MVAPAVLCDQHLLGEHKELHQLVGHIRAGNTAVVAGHADRGQVDTSRIQDRHTALVAEMDRRGFAHDSPMDYTDDLAMGAVDAARNREELRDRCDDCRARMDAAD